MRTVSVRYVVKAVNTSNQKVSLSALTVDSVSAERAVQDLGRITRLEVDAQVSFTGSGPYTLLADMVAPTGSMVARGEAHISTTAASPDQRYDTLIYTRFNSVSYTWEIAVPNGIYAVHLVAENPTTTGWLPSCLARGSAGSWGDRVPGMMRSWPKGFWQNTPITVARSSGAGRLAKIQVANAKRTAMKKGGVASSVRQSHQTPFPLLTH